LLEEQDCQTRELTGVIVSLGPGSYTGLRVGVMVAKTLAYSLKCALVPVPTFAAIAAEAGADDDSVEVIADALQGMLYHQGYGPRTEHGTRPVRGPLQILSREHWHQQRPRTSLVAGPGLTLPHGPENEFRRGPETPTLTGLIKVAGTLPPLGDAELMALEPLYVRGSSAEEKLRQEGREADSTCHAGSSPA
jgi:tRNA threonylcarbamoyladenosine biosynthesis protein TsaB